MGKKVTIGSAEYSKVTQKEATGDRDEKESVNRGRFGGAGSDQSCGERREL